MKKIILSLVLMAAAAISATAQISAGLGYVSKTWSDGSTDETLGGLYLNGNYTVMEIADGVQLTPGVALSILSGKDSGTKFSECNLGIPVNLSYSFEVAEGFKLVPFLGPTFILGLSLKGENGGISVNAYDKDLGLDIRRFDVAVGGGLALDMMDIIRVSFGYNKSLINRVKDADPAINSNEVHFGVAYLF